MDLDASMLVTNTVRKAYINNRLVSPIPLLLLVYQLDRGPRGEKITKKIISSSYFPERRVPLAPPVVPSPPGLPCTGEKDPVTAGSSIRFRGSLPKEKPRWPGAGDMERLRLSFWGEPTDNVCTRRKYGKVRKEMRKYERIKNLLTRNCPDLVGFTINTQMDFTYFLHSNSISVTAGSRRGKSFRDFTTHKYVLH